MSGYTPRQAAARQHDLVTVEQLRAAGLTDSGVTRRVRSGELRRVFRGVYTVSQARLSREALGLAAVLACGPGAGLSHYACATLYGVSRFSSPLIDVVSPRKRTLDGVRVHYIRTLDRTDLTTIRGTPVTTFARLQLDLADLARDEALRADGYLILRFSADDVQHYGAEVARQVLGALSVRPTS